MLHQAGLLDPATRADALRTAGGPEAEMAKLIVAFQWDDRIRQFADEHNTGNNAQEVRPYSAPSHCGRLPSTRAALPPLAADEIALWEEQLRVLKQQLLAESDRAAEAERRAKQLAAQLRAARDEAEEHDRDGNGQRHCDHQDSSVGYLAVCAQVLEARVREGFSG